MATPLSANAVRALDQVKMNLYMLYGAGYFTEEEWIKVDGLIHKGKYVFTSGPANILDSKDDELMFFDDANEKADLPAQGNQPFNPTKEPTVVVAERQIDSPTDSDRASIDVPTETPNHTSVETSSIDEPGPKPEDPAMFDFSQWDQDTPAEPEPEPEQEPEQEPAKVEEHPPVAPVEPTEDDQQFEPVEMPKREPVEIPAAGGLALGYTQEQLEEMKAFNASLTKAGKKPKPKKRDSTAYHTSSEQSTAYAPTPSEHETRIQSWASEVDAQECTTPASSSPSKKPDTPVNATPAMLVKQFIEAHGRPPSTSNDILQPKNPKFRPKQNPVVAPSGPKVPKLNVARGTILVAQSSQAKTSSIILEVKSGDQIRVLTHVSGITHMGVNIRTGHSGQITENVFKKDPNAPKVDQVIEQQRVLAQQKIRTPSISSTINGLDGMERRNAAEWDEVSSVSRYKPAAPVKAKPLGGLGASRFAVLDEAKSVSSGSEQTDFMQGISREDVSRLVDEKIAQILAAQQPNANSVATAGPLSRRKVGLNDPLKTVPPKTMTCWFWATPNKDCRFTADECRDLHEFIPITTSSPANLRSGKPTWGALADSIPPPTTTQIQAQIFTSGTPTSPFDNMFRDSSKSNKSCWYWANSDHCTYTAETCRYLHEYSPAGVAPKPNTWKKSWTRWGGSTSGEPSDEFGKSTDKVDAPWRAGSTKQEGKDEEIEDGELVLDVVADPPGHEWQDDEDPRGWGESAQKEGAINGLMNPGNWGGAVESALSVMNSGWGDASDRYKPPHVKALEEKAMIEAIGW